MPGKRWGRLRKVRKDGTYHDRGKLIIAWEKPNTMGKFLI